MRAFAGLSAAHERHAWSRRNAALLPQTGRLVTSVADAQGLGSHGTRGQVLNRSGVREQYGKIQDPTP
jgi:hypothetical protein